jgi:hypothetical protein
MKNLKLVFKIFVFTCVILPNSQANALVIIDEPIHNPRCFDPFFQAEHPAICYHYDPYYRFWVSEEWYHHNHHHHYRHLPVHHFGPFHGEMHRRHHGRHHRDD